MLKNRIVLILVVLANASVALAAPPQQDAEFELVAKLCGKLEHIDRVPDKTIPGRYSEKKTPIKDATLVVYEAPANTECCSDSRVAAETMTNKSGTFEFKSLTKGWYWMVARLDNRDYRISIRIGQLKDRQPVCSQLSFSIESPGKLAMRVRVPGR